MYRLTPPSSRFVENKKEPVKFSVGTAHLRYLLKWALSELSFQTQRLAIPVRFDEASDYLQFLHQQWLPSFLAVYNLLPAIASQPSDNTEEAGVLRQKLRQSFKQAFETFLTCNQRLLVSDLPVVSPHEREASGLVKQVALDSLAMWKNLFETLLTLSDDANTMKNHANAGGNIEINLSVTLPDSYLKLTHWLENECDLLLDMPLEQPAASFPIRTNQPSLYTEIVSGIMLLVLLIVAIMLLVQFWKFGLFLAILGLFLWVFFKHPLYLLAIWLGFSAGS